MERFVYKDQVVEYNIVYRKRKTVEIRIEGVMPTLTDTRS